MLYNLNINFRTIISAILSFLSTIRHAPHSEYAHLGKEAIFLLPYFPKENSIFFLFRRYAHE